MWNKHEEIFNKFGDVPGWMGICQGWAAASYMMPRPEAKVDLIAADGETVIPFFPHDIKALASLLWAQQEEMKDENFIIGGRCRKEYSEKYDGGPYQRTEDPDCFNINPGIWHMAIVNRIGITQRSFVMDESFDRQVWNFPVYAYEYSYFNVQSGAVISSHAQDVAIEFSEYTEDPFRAYRDAKKTK